MHLPAPGEKDHPPSEEEVVELVHETLDQLTMLADRLESFVGARSPVARTRRDDFGGQRDE